jgi:hypothetical protein
VQALLGTERVLLLCTGLLTLKMVGMIALNMIDTYPSLFRGVAFGMVPSDFYGGHSENPQTDKSQRWFYAMC